MKDSEIRRLILVIESNPEHMQSIETAFSESLMPHRIVSIATGAEAINYLHRRENYTDAPRPDLVLLDLDLPDKNGKDILAEIKANSNLRRIPIVVLTFSTDEDDIFRSYALQGNCYVVKSSDLNQLTQIIKRIEEFWLGIVTLPVE